MSMPPWGWWPLAFVGIALFEVSSARPDAPRSGRARMAVRRGWMFPALGWMWFLTSPGYVSPQRCSRVPRAAQRRLADGPWRVIGARRTHAGRGDATVLPRGGVPARDARDRAGVGPLLGVARVGGVVLITWVVFQIGFALAGPSPFVPRAREAAARAAAPRRSSARAVARVVVLARSPEGRDRRPTRVALVQGGGPQGRAPPGRAREVVERHLDATRTIEPGSADSSSGRRTSSTSTAVLRRQRDSSRDEVAAEAARLAVPLAVGITEDVAGRPGPLPQRTGGRDPAGRGDEPVRQGTRVPFGEYVPLRGCSSRSAPVDRSRPTRSPARARRCSTSHRRRRPTARASLS
jgi:apolipoprotein N-acyltransferase